MSDIAAELDIAADLKERLLGAELWFLEKWEMYGVNPDGKSVPDVLTDDEKIAVDIFKILRGTVDAIPPALIKTTEELRAAGPEAFEKILVQGVQVVGLGFSPASATEFVEVLSRTVQGVAGGD
jgi:hypothetical protein